MKKVRFISVAAFVVAVVTLSIFNSCSKQEVGDKVVAGKQVILSDHDKMINNAIKSFRAKVNYIRENPGYKSGEVLEADSAVWYLEATINYSHAFPNDYYGQMKIDTSYITLTRNNEGKVDMNELALKYDQMKLGVSNAYYNSGFGEKGLVLVDLTEETFKSDEITVKIVAVTGEKNSSTPPGFGIEGPFVEGDDWWYGEDKGKCEFTYESDAADQLQIAMNNYIPDPSGNYTFTNLTTVIKKGGDTDLRRPTDPEPPNNDFDYYLFSASEEWGQVTDDILCLEYGEMNIYFNYLKYLLYTKIPNQELTSGYCIESVIELEGTYGYVGQNIHYYHKGTFQFGIKLYRNPDDIAIEL
jgi:hypothetical protein